MIFCLILMSVCSIFWFVITGIAEFCHLERSKYSFLRGDLESRCGYPLNVSKDDKETILSLYDKEMHWYNIYNALTCMELKVIKTAGLLVAGTALLMLLILVPVSQLETSSMKARAEVYERAHNNAVIPSSMKYEIIELQESIEKKVCFREDHPYLSFYTGNDLDEIDVIEFIAKE